MMRTEPKPKKIRAVCRGCKAVREVVLPSRLCLRCYLTEKLCCPRP